jgi:hypothetical protein
MIEIFMLLLMIFLHIVDDYYLQGILASMKQRGWWEKNAPDRKYKYDYIVALLMHAFSWTFMIMLPITITLLLNPVAVALPVFIMVFGINWGVHMAIDHLKANVKVLNLVQDQTIHIIQIVLTWSLVFLIL